MTIEISAVVCTRNRVRFLEKCLRSLLRQTLEVDRYEVLVVDNGSTDETAVFAKEIAASAPNVRYVHESIIGLSRARNTGWRAAAADIVGYIDDDAVAGERWLEDALWCFRNVRPAPAWVGGPIDLEWEVPNPGWIDDELAVPLGKVFWGPERRFLRFPERLGGGNSFYDRRWLVWLGGFDERLGRQGGSLLSGEETQLQRRLEAAGGSLYYHPGVQIRHYVPVARTRPVWFYRRYFWGGVSDFFIQRTMTDTSPCAAAARHEEYGGRAGRLVRNLFRSIGLCVSRNQAIHARIYLAYAAGYLSAFFRWQR